ncbi:hypothetical protein GGF37_000049 [Kickxella alabastrina]|nr:hypothetical protein GGF37_000049 [Kickxella alabastrina]
MSTEADEWLQILAQHPIFSEPPQLPSVSSASTSKPNGVRRERVAVRGTDFFVAVGSEVRWINLKACKDAFVKSESRRLGARDGVSKEDAVCGVEWFRLGCEALTFDIRKLVINTNGKLLAAMGAQTVAVVVLPARGATGRSGGAFDSARHDDDEAQQAHWVDCRSMALSNMSSAASARVVDVLWHAMSTAESHIAILYASGTLRLFDVSESVDEPEQTVAVFRGGFSADQTVSMSMGGAGAAGWARATVYVATTGGSIYALCPLLPQRCYADRAWLNALYETATLDVREWQAEEYETNGTVVSPPELVEARAAVRWLEQVRELAGADNDDDRVCLALPAALAQPLAPQGPFLMQPEPEPIGSYDSDSDSNSETGDVSDDASAVLRLETPGGLGLIAVAYCDAHVDIFADLEPVIGRWADIKHAMRGRSLPVLATLASVDLAINSLVTGDTTYNQRPSGAVALVGDPLSGSIFYALHSRGAHRIDLRTFGTLLDRSVSQGDEASHAAMLERLAAAQPTVQCVVHTNPCNGERAMPVVGAAVVDDIYLSYSLLALVAPSQLVGASLPLISEREGEVEATLASAKGDGRAPRRLDLSIGAKDIVYVPCLPASGYNEPAQMPIHQPRLVLGDNDRADGVNVDVGEAKLRILGEVVGQLRAQLASISQAHTNMRAHLDLQVKEHKRQYDKLSKISLGFQNHFNQMRASQQRINRLRDNASRQGMRVDHMLRQLITHYQPELTPTERAFAQDVRRMDDGINGAAGYEQLVDRLQERLNDMRALSKSVNPAAGCSGTPGKAQPQVSDSVLENIKSTLENEQEALAETCERISELQVRLEDVPS